MFNDEASWETNRSQGVCQLGPAVREVQFGGQPSVLAESLIDAPTDTRVLLCPVVYLPERQWGMVSKAASRNER